MNDKQKQSISTGQVSQPFDTTTNTSVGFRFYTQTELAQAWYIVSVAEDGNSFTVKNRITQQVLTLTKEGE